MVGSAAANAVMLRGAASEIVLIGRDRKRAVGIVGGPTRIIQSIGSHEHSALAVSMLEQEVEGLGPVALSLPRIVACTGVVPTLLPNLSDGEHAALKRSAEVLIEAGGGRW